MTAPARAIPGRSATGFVGTRRGECSHAARPRQVPIRHGPCRLSLPVPSFPLPQCVGTAPGCACGLGGLSRSILPSAPTWRSLWGCAVSLRICRLVLPLQNTAFAFWTDRNQAMLPAPLCTRSLPSTPRPRPMPLCPHPLRVCPSFYCSVAPAVPVCGTAVQKRVPQNV